MRKLTKNGEIKNWYKKTDKKLVNWKTNMRKLKKWIENWENLQKIGELKKADMSKLTKNEIKNKHEKT